ncbi:MAG: O-acetyl-ADP-ribose deacetylase [Gammaproteobacteria bacterium]|nr:O-acetyl-ADP-ribose deacetylase [Gammaproteobacteria bacterium]
MTILEAKQGDITEERVDVIVNAANASLLGGGGVDGAIHRAAGSELLAECRTLQGCETGQAKITGGYLLPVEYVIHTVGPIWHGGDTNEAKLLTSCYERSLELADAHGLKSIVFPAISTGVYGYPLEAACVIAVKSVASFDSANLEVARFICFDATTLEIYKTLLSHR